MFDFQAPLFLILLAVVPVLILMQRRTHLGTTKLRKNITFFFRAAALLCAIFALANLHRTDKEQRLAVVFLIDTSESISPSQHEGVINQINTAVAKLKPTDRFGIIAFAKDTAILAEIRQKQDQSLAVVLETIAEQRMQRDGTDLITALKRAIALLPDDYHRRVVLFSDGIHNAGGISLENYLPLLTASDVEILTIRLDTLQDAVRVARSVRGVQFTGGCSSYQEFS
ncbi:MAG: VWA domain-containing protein [Proteobacteria bacterium]|nr:VWA domain-containing protein [Pseudomonadota bacterium]